MILKIRVVIVIFLIIVTLISAFTIKSTVKDEIYVSAKPDNRPQIIIDAGHGGLTNTTF